MDKKVRSVKEVKGKSVSDNIKKQIVRNAQVPLRETAVKTVDLNLPGNIQNLPKDLTSSPSNTEPAQSQKVKSIASSHSKMRKSTEKENADKIQDDIKRVNIPFSEIKYRGLVDLGSLEAVLAENVSESNSGCLAKRRACLPNRDPEPVLSDYFTPKFDTEYVFSFPPAPVNATMSWTFNPRSIVDVLEMIESDNNSINS